MSLDVEALLAQHDIPKFVLAELANVSPQDLSVYLRHGNLPVQKVIKIEQSARDLEMIFACLQDMGNSSGVFLTVRVRDIKSIRNFIEWAHKQKQEAIQ